jgi:hypothetical protein
VARLEARRVAILNVLVGLVGGACGPTTKPVSTKARGSMNRSTAEVTVKSCLSLVSPDASDLPSHGRRQTMLFIKRLLTVAGMIVALTALAPVAAAGSHQAFHLDKSSPDHTVVRVARGRSQERGEGNRANPA